MIRFLFSLLMVHFCFILMSCTSADLDENGNPISDESGAAAPFEDTEFADTAATASPQTGGEDDLESELGGADDTLTAQPPADEGQAQAQAEQPPPADNDGELDLDKELSDQDLQPEPLAESEVLAEEVPPPAEVAPEVPPPAEAPPPAPEKAKITNIRFMNNANGGTVVIETTKPVTYQSRMNSATQQFVIEVADVELPASLQRPYNMKEFGSRFGSVNAYQSAGSNTARIVIQMAGAMSAEPLVQQEGTSLVVIPPAPAPVAAAPPPPEKETSASHHEGALQARTLDEFLTGNQKFYGRAISLQVKDADVRDVVNFLAEESGANIVMSDDVTGKISLKLRKIPWDQALVTVMRSKGLGYTRQGNVLRISTLKTLQTETEASNKLIESQKAIVPSVVQVIPISYADVAEILKSVTPFLTKSIGQAVVDNRSSTLIVTDRQEVVDRVVKLVKTLDIQPAQVSIESKIVEAVEGLETFLGVNWNLTGSAVNLGKGTNGAPIDMRIGGQSGSLSSEFTGGQPFKTNLHIGYMDVLGDLTATLSLAERDSLAKVISAPRISTMNREKSTIVQQGENISVITTKSEQTGATTKTEKRTPYKLELSVSPQITSDGGVIMDLDVQRDFLGPVLDQETGARAVNTRKAKTKILVRNGQTAVIGGIYTSDETSAESGIPGLKNLPVIGWLFKNRTFSRDKNELLIFMTPRILAADANGNEQASN